ncbi:MAG: PIG-L family deacetylase [Candidatus Doudnabacteria bacterium]|nr:PIG-L family deacetylase [Candidatus Doudnabacteria bacterium]
MTKILALGAHPDDVEFGGAAALLIKEVQKGNHAKIAVCSLGEAGTNGTPAARKQESIEASELIGADIEFLQMGSDCHIVYQPQNSIKIAKIIRLFKPNIVLAQSLTQNQHPDHRILAMLARDACRFARYGGVKELKKLPIHKIDALYFYGSSAEWDNKPDIVIDVSEVQRLWEKTMLAHTSQMRTKAYLNLVNSKARALGASIGTKYAIGLWTNDPVRLHNLSDLTLSSRNY